MTPALPGFHCYWRIDLDDEPTANRGISFSTWPEDSWLVTHYPDKEAALEGLQEMLGYPGRRRNGSRCRIVRVTVKKAKKG